MFLSATLTEKMPITDAGVIAILGYAVVFFGLILLMLVITILGKSFSSKSAAPKASASTAPAAPAAAPAAPVANEQLAPGSAGNIKLHNVAPKTAAMLMAIVANKLGKPLNELRFISIKEVE